MRKGKRLVSLLLTLVMIFGLLPLNGMTVKAANPKEEPAPKLVEGEWVQTTKVEGGKEYVIVAGEDDAALIGDGTDKNAVPVTVSEKKVSDFAENAVWTYDEEKGLFTQNEEVYVKVINTVLANQWNIDGLKQELKYDEEAGLTMLQMSQYGDNRRLIYKGKEFKTEKVDKKEISTKNSLRLFTKEEEEIVNYDDQIMTLEEPMEPMADEVIPEHIYVPVTNIKKDTNYVIVAEDADIALTNVNGVPGTTAVSIESDGKILSVSENAVWKTRGTNWDGSEMVFEQGNRVLLQNNSVIGSGSNQTWLVNKENNTGSILGYHANGSIYYLAYENSNFVVKKYGDGIWNKPSASQVNGLMGVRLYEQVPTLAKITVELKLDDVSKGTTEVVFNRLNASDTQKFSAGQFGDLLPEGASLEKIEKKVKITDWPYEKTEIVASNATEAAGYEVDLAAADVINYICYFKDNSPTREITAEFYCIDDVTKCMYSVDAMEKPENVFDATNTALGYIGTVTKIIDRNATNNLLSDPLTYFGVGNDIKDALPKDNVNLYEVRSAKRALKNLNIPTTQWIYATAGTIAPNYAQNYIDSKDYPVLAEIQPKSLSGATLLVSELDNTNTIKFIYLKSKKSTINYYVVDKEGNRQLITSRDAIVSGTKILFDDFTKDPSYAEFDKTVLDYTGFEREALVGRFEELFTDVIPDENTKPTEKKFAVTPDFEMKQSSQGDEYVLNVYYGEPWKAGKGSIQLPVKMYDFDADGMFFEYCLGGSMAESYGYSMYQNEDGTGLVEDQLITKELLEKNGVEFDGNPHPQYTEKAYDLVAGLINNGVMWDGKTGGNDNWPANDLEAQNLKIRTLVSSVKGKLGTYQDALDALADGVVEEREVTNAYTAAAYMFSRFFNGDGTYGKPVDEIHALELKQYPTYNGNDWYIYDAQWQSGVTKGVIENTLNKDGYISNATSQSNYLSAFYMPLDWAEVDESNTYDQYPKANFLFTTVGQGTFVYESSKDLEFIFIGDDDVYLYINGILAVDLGGAHQALEKTLRLNDVKEKCGLQDGEKADFTFYHMERHGTGSNFRMITNINVSARELGTHKYAYQGENLIGSGATVEADVPYYYAFQLNNTGERDMFNLSFWDQDLGVSLFPLGNADDLPSKYDNKFNNVLKTWGDVYLEIFDGHNTDGSNHHPEIEKYRFAAVPGKGWHPVVSSTDPLNPEPDKTGYAFGEINRVKISELYKRMNGKDPSAYPDVTGMSEADREACYRELMEEVLRNGIRVGQSIIVSGFLHTLSAGEVYNNEVQTYGSDWQMNEVHGSDTHKVVARDVANVVKVIDYGKPVTYDFYEIFQKFTADAGKYKNVKLNTGEAGIDHPTYEDADKVSAYKDSKIKVHRGDGWGYFWNAGTSLEDTKFTFAPDDIMDQSAKFGFEVDRTGTNDKGEELTEAYPKFLTIYPAEVVYYEDNFTGLKDENGNAINDNVKDGGGIIYTGGYDFKGEDTVSEQDSDAGTSGNKDNALNGDQQYGYDQNYAESSGTGDSNGTSVQMVRGDEPTKAMFTFKGTGFDIVGRTDNESTLITYVVRKASDNKVVEIGSVDTLYVNGTLYQIPVIHVENLDYDEYTVTLTVNVVNDAAKRCTFYLDGIRIYNPMGTAEKPYLESEDGARVEKLNALILGNNRITEEGFVSENGELTTTGINVEGARAALVNVMDFLFLPLTYTEDVDHPVGKNTKTEGNNPATNTDSLLSVLRHGPNNEIYLDRECGIAMILDSNPYDHKGTLQVEAKLVQTGTGAHDNSSAVLSYWDGKGHTEANFEKIDEVKTTMAMYYQIPKEAFIPIEGGKYLVVIRGGDDGILDMQYPTHMISFSNVKYKGTEITENPTEYDDNMLDEWKMPTGYNHYLKNIVLPESLKIQKNNTFNVIIEDSGEESWEDFVKEETNKKTAKLNITSRLSEKTDPVNVNFKVKESNGNVSLEIKAPKTAGVYTITLEYPSSGGETETFSFSINVYNPGKGN